MKTGALSKAKQRWNALRSSAVVIQRIYTDPETGEEFPLLLLPNENFKDDPFSCLSYMGGKHLQRMNYFEELRDTRPWHLEAHKSHKMREMMHLILDEL